MLDFLFKKSNTAPAKLFYHTDIHSHMMPGVDHGAADEEESLMLISQQQELGIDQFILTPHVTEATFENTPETLGQGYERLLKALSHANLNIKTAYSAEYRIDSLFREQLADNRLVPMPGNRLLIENAYAQEPWGLDQLIFDLNIKGFTPIMAHPERFAYYFKKPQRLRDLHDAGALFQINLLSLAGYHGKDVRKQAEAIIDAGLIDYLGSDVHNTVHTDTIRDYITSKHWQRLIPKIEPNLLNDTIFD